MKKYMSSLILALCLGTFSWGQEAGAPLDTKKLREEQDILRKILTTKLNNFAQSPYFSNINSFYLAGQGIVLVIDTTGFRFLPKGPDAPTPTTRMSVRPAGNSL
jgi:hypothetical protein